MERSNEQTKKKKPQRKLDKNRKMIEAAVMTAVFTAMAVVLKSVTKVNIPIMGAGGMAVNFAGIFSFFPAIIYGPIYGGVSSALCDLIGYLIKPDGPYNPVLTLVAFLGGVIKGVVWIAITKGFVNKKVMKSVLAGLFALFLVLGIAFTVSLQSDGIISGPITKQSELPFKDEVMTAELSPLSNVAISLAKYNNDTITLTHAEPNEEGICVLPYYLESGAGTTKISKIDAEVFNNENIKEIIVPESYTTVNVPKDFVLTNTDIVIRSLTPSESLKSFADSNGINIEEAYYDYLATKVDSLGIEFENENFSFKSGDNYRKYLSGYVNFTTIGFILSGALGLLIMLVGLILSKTGVFKQSEKSGIYLRVLPTVLISGLVVTTINTFVLLETIASLQGRVFWIYYLPRFAEEVFVSIVQAYAITILITALSANKTFSKLFGLNDINTGKAGSKEK